MFVLSSVRLNADDCTSPSDDRSVVKCSDDSVIVSLGKVNESEHG